MNKTTRNLLILIFSSSILLACLVFSAVWIMDNPGLLLPQSTGDQQTEISLAGILAAPTLQTL